MPAIRRKQHAFTLVEIMVVVAIFGIILIIAVPGWIRARAKSAQTICQENLTKIDHAKENWAFENSKDQGAPPTDNDLFGQESYVRDTPYCPSGGKYTIKPVGQLPECSLSSKGHFIVQ